MVTPKMSTVSPPKPWERAGGAGKNFTCSLPATTQLMRDSEHHNTLIYYSSIPDYDGDQ
jgi:hypothetical protein